MAVPSQATAQGPIPQVRHSTYDFTEGPADPNEGLAEVWVDAKSPGNGFTYSVGTIEIQQTNLPGGAPATFSGVDALESGDLLGFQVLAPTVDQKQVVMLQCVGPNIDPMSPDFGRNQAISWQRFYYGTAEDSARWTNARGISVWAVAGANGEPDLTNTRIAICGETDCNSLPLDQSPVDVPSGLFGKGFIAVFDGLGTLRWTYLFYGVDAGGSIQGDMAVTDVSIRVQDGQDIVTYCGVSNCGTANLTPDSAAPLLPFAAPGNCASAAGGIGHAAGPFSDWDGFVGRLINPSAAQVPPASPQFHSVVGGSRIDGLFGIDEIDEDRFVVVGTTSTDSGQPVAATFPFTSMCVPAVQTGAYSMGVVMAFDASAVPAGNLMLEWSQHVGSLEMYDCNGNIAASRTVLRDVCVQRSHDRDIDQDNSPDALVVAVGSTNDCFLADPADPNPLGLGASSVIGSHQGGSEGIVIGLRAGSSSGYEFECLSYHGSPGDDDLRGVRAWSEHLDHFYVVGSIGTAPATDIEVTKFRVYGQQLLSPEQRVRLDAPGIPPVAAPTLGYAPTRMGTENVGFEGEQGGGIAVDDRARVTVVGAMTDALAVGTYPESVLLYDDDSVVGRANNNPLEAYRAVLDMLPAQVGRTDGTGTPHPDYPTAASFGGTTPECALTLYGNRIGQAAPALSRILIDASFSSGGTAVGAPCAGCSMFLVVDRPPVQAIALSAWQIGFPGSGTPPVPAELDGVLYWTTGAAVTYVVGVGGQTLDQLWAIPANTSGTVTVQLICALAAPVPGGVTGPVCGQGVSMIAASPALWLSF